MPQRRKEKAVLRLLSGICPWREWRLYMELKGAHWKEGGARGRCWLAAGVRFSVPAKRKVLRG